MADGSGAAGARYRAFISYSHRDAVFVARLHQRLEGYVLPKRLGAERRLTPIFKDREELPAAHDLSAQVRAALAVSDCLVVVCSPDAAASPWVGREIELFRELHPDRPIFAALIRGEPAEAFPLTLANSGAEPLAADFRRERDGDRLALLKLVAGMASVGVDQLIQRDAQRRLRAVMAITAAALIGMVAMGGMMVVALEARAESDHQRREAEKLVEFMRTDLRDDLKSLGRLPLMKAVNARALAYYRSQRVDRLPADSLAKWARLLHAMGEDEAAQGNVGEARAHFDEAWRVSSTLLTAEPEEPNRLFTHAQSAYWRGYADYLDRRTGAARVAWNTYLTLAERLGAEEPGSKRGSQEVGYAQGNLCTLAVEQERALSRALVHCQESLNSMRRALEIAPDDVELKVDVATRLAWLAIVQVELGDLGAAQINRLAQVDLLEGLLRRDPDNAQLKASWAISQRALSTIAYRQGDVAAARRHLRAAGATFRSLSAMDPTNVSWRDQATYADQALAKLSDPSFKEKP